MAMTVKITHEPLQKAGIYAGRGAQVLENRSPKVQENVNAGHLLQNGQRNSKE